LQSEKEDFDMKSRIGKLMVAILAFMSTGAVVPAFADETKRVADATAVIKELEAMPEMKIPPALFKEAAGIAIVPGVMKGGIIVAGRFGTGILVEREKSGTWSPPVFISLGGGSLGMQIGAESTDFIMVFKTRRSLEGMKTGKFTIGVDASVAAGPVGRTVEAATDALMKAEILSYSRTRGLFAGASMEGAVLHIDPDANAAFYKQKKVATADILSGKVTTDSKEVAQLHEILTKFASGK
jgi:lipid-binding SYLF domain-containing protein